MVDFTGGIVEVINLKPEPTSLFDDLMKVQQTGSLVTASIFESFEPKNLKGLIKKHSYSMTKLEEITTIDNKTIQLLILKNPYGDSEWTGAFSKNSKEWELISSQDRNRLMLKNEEDGEFFMSVEDFTEYFDRVQLCHLCPDAFDRQSCSSDWNIEVHHGEWSHDYSKTPKKFKVELQKAGTIVIALMQKNGRKELKSYFTTCIEVRESTSSKIISSNCPQAFGFLGFRETTARFELQAGDYDIIPINIWRGDGEFMLRVFTGTEAKFSNCLEQYGFKCR